ncbi:MAG: CRISPR-associated endoribonuclease Cas6 [Thermoproteota archaeon]
MRVLIRLEAVKDCVYDLMYHRKLQGLLYGLLRDTPYSGLHDQEGYKFFCFSNIFPPRDVTEGNRRSLLVSSPDKELVKVFEGKFRDFQDKNVNLNIGEWSFQVDSVKTFDLSIGKSCKLVTGTPIVIRISENRFEQYHIHPDKDYEYVYWKKRYPLGVFIRQLEENLFKKYIQFHGSTEESFTVFQELKYRKQVCNHVPIHGREVKMIGTLWEFQFHNLNKKQRKILKFGIDAGFGELNSLGFGFMNPLR